MCLNHLNGREPSKRNARLTKERVCLRKGRKQDASREPSAIPPLTGSISLGRDYFAYTHF